MNATEAPTPACDYCGLPLPTTLRSGHAEKPTPTAEYCCFGCRFAASIARERAETGHAHWLMARLALAAFLSLNVMMFSMVLWTRDVYAVHDAAPRAMTMLDELLRYTCLVLSLPVVLLLGGPLVENAVATLRARRLSTDVLLVLGIAAALVYSIVSVVRDEGHVYFEVACVVLIAVTLGRWFEATGKQRTTAALAALERLLPNTVRLVCGDREESVPLAQVREGDLVRVVAGERFAVDGVVVRHQAAVDEQLITGESVPVEKRPGDRVYAGTLSLDGDIYVQATAAPTAGALSRIVETVRAAAARKDRYQSLADRVAAWFTPLVIAVALAAFVFHARAASPADGIMAALAVLLIACPCALGLATPMAIWTALGFAARRQVLFRDGDALVRLASVSRMAFDKTGTLSTGKASVERFVAGENESAECVLGAAAALSGGSSHPLSAAVLQFAAAAEPYCANGVRTIAGLGLAADIKELGGKAYLGSPRLMESERLACDAKVAAAIARAQAAGEAVVCVGWSGRVRGAFALAESLRNEAAVAVEQLQQRGLAVCVLSGDHATRCEPLRNMGLAVRAELMPTDKLAAVEELRAAARREGGVVMVGDGVNDAPALAAADVGIALGCGADIARETAGVCLLSDDLLRLPWAIDLARRTVRTIRWNLAFAFVYNVAGIALAAAGYLNPIVAAIAMTASSLLVISNSLRLAHDEGASATVAEASPATADARIPSPESPAPSPCP